MRDNLVQPQGSTLGLFSELGTDISTGFTDVTLEMYGGSVTDDGTNNLTALEKIATLVNAGENISLVLGSGTYKVNGSVKFTAPVKIEGKGSVLPQGTNESSYSQLLDVRTSGTGYFIEFSDGDTTSLGFNLSDFLITGVKSNGLQGVLISAISWTGHVSNLKITSFGKQGLSFKHLNDTQFINLAVLSCGGFVDSVAYYALDFVTEANSTTAVANSCNFVNLHMEHCRYAINYSGWFNNFTNCHIEFGSATVTDDLSPWIKINSIARTTNFTNCNFVYTSWQNIISALSDISDTSTVISEIPAAISTVTTDTTALWPLNEYNTQIIFDGCNFTTPSGLASFLYLPYIKAVITNSQFMQCSFINNPPITIGLRSRVTSSDFFASVVTGDTSTFASSVNGKINSVIYIPTGWGLFNSCHFKLMTSGYSSTAITSSKAELSSVINITLDGFTNTITSGSTFTSSGSQVLDSLKIINSSDSTEIIDLDPSTGSLLISNSSHNYSVYGDTTGSIAFKIDANAATLKIVQSSSYVSIVTPATKQLYIGSSTVPAENIWAARFITTAFSMTYSSLIPNTTDTSDLGSSTNRFKDGYFSDKVIIGGNTAITNVAVPASATATGTVGQMASDGSYVYVCTATNTWKRAALSTW